MNESKLNKISVLSECISGIVETLEESPLKDSLRQYATMIYNVAEQMKVDERILAEKVIDNTIDNAKTKPSLTSVSTVDELPETGSRDKLYICNGEMFFFDGPLGWTKISEAKEFTAFDFVEMFDNVREDIAEILTKESKKLVIRKRSMFPENSYTIELDSMSFEVYSKTELIEYLNNVGILSYTLTKMECR